LSDLKALIFDVDGTLAETEEAHRVAFNDAFAHFGHAWRWDPVLYKRLLRVTGGRKRIRHYLEDVGAPECAHTDLDEHIAEIHVYKTALFQERLESGAVPLRPGIARLIEEARAAGLRLAIATTTSPGNVESLLKSTLGAKALDWFDAVATGGNVPELKPAPDVYQWVLDKLGVCAEDCLALEDSTNGLLSAKGAGVPVVITVNPYTDDNDFTGAGVIVDGLGGPDAPFRVIRGDAHGCTYADVRLLRAWHADLTEGC
jgi:HAD superfamily hydrolase (TIGR01509 family)